MSRKLVSLLVIVAMMMTFAFSFTANADVTTDEPVELIWYFGGTWPQSDQDAVFAEVNRMLGEKLNTTIDFRPLTYGDLTTKMNVVISSGEKYDMCFTSNWCNYYAQNVAKGAYVALDELLPKYAPRTYAQVVPAFWDATRIGGKIYAVVCEQVSARIACYTFLENEMIASGYDPATQIVPNDVRSIEPYLEYAVSKNPDAYFSTSMDAVPEYLQQEWINDVSTPGAIDLTAGNTTVVNQYKLDSTKKFIEDLRYFADKGYMKVETRLASASDSSADRENHLVVLGLGGTYKPGGEIFESSNYHETVKQFPSGAAVLTTGGIIATMQAISTTSDNPERALMVLEELNSTEEGDDYNEIYNTLCFGIEGTNWTRDEEGFRVQESFTCNTEWMFASNFQAVVQQGQPANVWEDTRTLNNTAAVSPLCGFVFDNTAVQTEVSNCTAIYSEYSRLMAIGAITDAEYEEMVSRMDAAGADTIIAEMQAQVDAWLATR